MKYSSSILAVLLLSGASAMAGTPTAEQLMAGYAADGAGPFSAERGRVLWERDGRNAERRCSTCHGSDLGRPGKHQRTGKAIDPLSPSASPERLSDAKKVEKWFKRNCKWTWGRVCSPAEKGDLLSFIQQGHEREGVQ
jgi:hypothetical protein